MKMKHLPLALATAAIVATLIACTFVIVREQAVDELFIDQVQQVVFDGQVLKVDLGRTWLQGGELESPGDVESKTVVRVVLTQTAAGQMHQHLTNLMEAIRRQQPKPL